MARGDAWERLRWPLPFGMLIEWDLGMDVVFYGVGGNLCVIFLCLRSLTIDKCCWTLVLTGVTRENTLKLVCKEIRSHLIVENLYLKTLLVKH